MEAGSGEIDRLPRGMRDLAAISALAAVWVNDDPIRVAEGLAGALVNLLDLRFAYVRLPARAGRPEHEVVRTGGAAADSDGVRAIAEVLASRLNQSPRTAQAIRNPLGSGEVRLIVLPLGQDGEPGLLAAASDRPDFPTEQERLLIGVGANQATVIIEGKHALERERHQSEARQRRLLDEAEAERSQLAQVFDLSPAYTAVLRGPDHIYERANGRYYQLVGERELIGKPVREAIPEIDGQAHIEILDRVLRTGEPFVGTDMPLVLRRVPGGPLEKRVVDFVCQPLRDASGAVYGVLSHGVDLTERKRAEENQSLLAAIVESSDDAIVSKTLNGQILSWNAGAERIFGYTSNEAVGRPITMIIPTERQDEERLILERIRRGERVEHLETVRVSKHGRRIDISLTVSPVRDAAGHIVAVSKVARDITDRKRAEEALQDADTRKEQFIALLAHELRNPLAALGNSLNVLRLSGIESNVAASSRTTMERQHSHMVRLVDDLLDVSRISQNKIELRRSRVQLSDVLNSAVETVRPLIEAAGHSLTVSLPQSPVFLDADLTRLSQVFGNLLSNSVKYTERGGSIWLSAERQGGDAVIVVRDTGSGIPPEALPRIFDMFSQVERTLERNSGGLGIGLALVKGLVEMHRGTVTAESGGQGQGSTFTVRLPVMDREPAPAALEMPEEPPSQAGPQRRILVVDDNRDAAMSLATLLKLMSNDVRTAHSGREALSAAESFRPELVLMDVGMPVMDGYDTTRHLREQRWGKHIVVYALTGWGQEADRLKSQEAGCNGHLVKPVNLRDLERVLADLPAGSGPERPL